MNNTYSNDKLVIFDLDGTLLNTVSDLGNAVNHTLEAHGLPLHEIPEYKMMVGHGMRNLVKTALPATHQDDNFVDRFLKEFLDWYIDHVDSETVPYPGIPEIVDKLNADGFKLAIASNKIQRGTELLIRKFFPDIPFVAVCGNSPEFPLKPDAELVKFIMRKAGTEACDTVMVGDSGTDIRTARNAGIKVVAVTWGFRPRQDLLEADAIVDRAEDMLSVLRKKENLYFP